mgnify:CR=1 FL=1
MSGSSLTALEIESTAAFVTLEIASPTMCLLLSVKDDEASPAIEVNEDFVIIGEFFLTIVDLFIRLIPIVHVGCSDTRWSIFILLHSFFMIVRAVSVFTLLVWNE